MQKVSRVSSTCGSIILFGTFIIITGLVYSDKIIIRTDLMPSAGGQINSYELVLSTPTIMNLVFSSALCMFT
jgi:hypothetical protein